MTTYNISINKGENITKELLNDPFLFHKNLNKDGLTRNDPKFGLWIWEGKANESSELYYSDGFWRFPTIEEWQLISKNEPNLLSL